MTSTLRENCCTCKRQHLTTIAEQWCPACDEFLCPPCTIHHKAAKASKDHKTVDLINAKKLRPILLDIKTECEIHNENFEYFCPNHEVSFCVRCTHEHKQCDGLTLLRDFKGTKNASIIVELNQSFSNLKDILNQLKRRKTANLADFKGQFKDCMKHIKDVRIKINKKLDEIENKMLEEIEDLYRKSNKKLVDMVEELEKQEQKIEKIRSDFDVINKDASDIQIFLGARKFLNETNIIGDSVKQFTTHDQMKIIEMAVTMPPKDIENDWREYFGAVNLVGKPCDVSFHKQLVKQAQLLSPVYDIGGILLRERLDIPLYDLGEHSTIWGCCYADDGSIIITHHKQSRVIVLKENGAFCREIKLENKPNKVVFAKGNMYVSSHVNKTLTLIEFCSGKSLKNVNFKHTCDALALADDRLIINIVGHEYVILNLNLEKVGCIPIKTINAHHLSHFKQNIYFAENEVSCYGLSGQIMWKLQDEHLPNVCCCSVDRHGNVFVSGSDDSKVFVVSSDGKKWKTVAELKNMGNASAIYHDRRRNRLLVISELTSRLQEFYVQY